MSSTSPRVAAKKSECPNHDRRVHMDAAIVEVSFPRGRIPVAGYRCGECGEELIPGGTLGRAQELARGLGLVGVEHSDTRKAMLIGGSVGATIPPAQLQRLGIKPGTELSFELVGDHIELRVRDPGKSARPAKPPKRSPRKRRP